MKLKLMVVNEGIKPTFVKGNLESYIDITSASVNIMTRVMKKTSASIRK